MQKRPRLPGIPMEAKRSSRRLCQDFLLTRCFPLRLLKTPGVALSVGWQLDGLADGVHEPTQKTWVVQDPSFSRATARGAELADDERLEHC
jgi:hypothetical protein